MKIAIVVQGRFHAFDLARALLSRGHDVAVLTNYPVWAARRFGLPRERVRSFPIHGVLSRAVNTTGVQAIAAWWERIGHQMFGRWAARVLSREQWDVIHCWSGVSEEILHSPAAKGALTLLMRGSSHVATQRRLLDDEVARVSVSLDRPSDWMVARETREYALADQINVLSTFSQRSFEEEGVCSSRVSVLPLGVQVDLFRPPPSVVAERRRRILEGQRLRVLYVGAVSYRKGFLDLARVIEVMPSEKFEFTLVGAVMPETADRVAGFGTKIRVLGKVPQADLPTVYHAADVFVFPTIEDGFPVVLAQAKAAGLPIITTPNGAGEDLVMPDRDGWIVPIRQPDAIVQRLTWCDANRQRLADMIASREHAASREWAEVAEDFERICEPRVRVKEDRVDGE